MLLPLLAVTSLPAPARGTKKDSFDAVFFHALSSTTGGLIPQTPWVGLTKFFAIFVGLISSVMKEKWAYTLPECTVVTVAQENVICASGDPQQTGNRSDYSYGGNWGMIGSDD